MRIGIHTQYYPPEMGAPQARLSELAQRCAAAGDEVFVLTAMPSYPGGRVHEGYGGIWSREKRDGVTILRTWAYPTRSVRMLPRLWNYFSFVCSSLVGGIAALPKLDFLLTESPPLFLGISGWLLSRVCRARWIFNVSDLWPESAVRLGFVQEGPALRVAEALETFCYRRAALITGQSKEILSDISGRHPLKPVYHLSNGVDTSVFRPAPRAGVDGACVAMYAGLHGVAQGLEQLVEAAGYLQSTPGLRITLVGDGPQKAELVEQARRRHLDNIEFLDARSRGEMPQLIASADIAIIPLRIRLPGAVPSKIYEAMAAGLPIVLAAEGEAADIVRNAGCGLVVSPGDCKALADAIRVLAKSPDLRRELGEAGRRAACERFDRSAIVKRFREHLSHVLGRHENRASTNAIERLICAFALLALAPIMALIGLAVIIENGFPVLFRQERVGRFGAIFNIVKFRTMRCGAPGTAITISGDERITRVGRLLRRYKLDEIPQLWNVLRGDMSLVGPRPEVPRYVDTTDPEWQSVLSVRPGITCVSSVLYRDEERLLATASDPEAFYRQKLLPSKLRLSAEYLRRRTALSDLRLIVATVSSVVRPNRKKQGEESIWP